MRSRLRDRLAFAVRPSKALLLSSPAYCYSPLAMMAAGVKMIVGVLACLLLCFTRLSMMKSYFCIRRQNFRIEIADGFGIEAADGVKDAGICDDLSQLRIRLREAQSQDMTCGCGPHFEAPDDNEQVQWRTASRRVDLVHRDLLRLSSMPATRRPGDLMSRSRYWHYSSVPFPCSMLLLAGPVAPARLSESR
jgi:hypothetical protein